MQLRSDDPSTRQRTRVKHPKPASRKPVSKRHTRGFKWKSTDREHRFESGFLSRPVQQFSAQGGASFRCYGSGAKR